MFDSSIALAPTVIAAGQFIVSVLTRTDDTSCNITAFSALRVYALTENNLFITGIVVLTALVPFGTNLVRDS